jgi:hypothetical protein
MTPEVNEEQSQNSSYFSQSNNANYAQGFPQPNYSNPYTSGRIPPQVQQGFGIVATNGKAIASFILSLLGISLLGVIFGHIASSEIRNSGGRQGGSGFATAGLILGWLGMVGWFFFWILYIVALNSIGYY